MGFSQINMPLPGKTGKTDNTQYNGSTKPSPTGRTPETLPGWLGHFSEDGAKGRYEKLARIGNSGI